MTLQDLQAALAKTKALTIKGGKVRIGDDLLPDSPQDTTFAVGSLSPSDDDELVLIGEFGEDITFEKFVKAIGFEAATKKDSCLPGSLGEEINRIKPKSASITLVRPFESDSYEVASAQFTIEANKGAATWKPFKEPLDKLFSIGFTSLTIEVVRPFDSEYRELNATIIGKIAFLGIELSVQVEAPNFYITAEQIGSCKVDLRDYFLKDLEMDLPLKAFETIPTFEIRNTAVVIQPELYYAFTMSIEPGTELKIAGKSLPNLSLAVSCSTVGGLTSLDWQFEASAKQDEGFPIFALIEDLAKQVGITKEVKLPEAVRDLITIESVAVSCSGSKVFGFECWGKFTLDKTVLDCCFTIKHNLDESDPDSATIFGGQILFGPKDKPPLSFSLLFSSKTDSKYCLAAYNDPYGHELKIKDLVERISPDLAKSIPSSLSMTLKSALLAYYSKSAADSEPETVAANGSEAESAVLFGVDLGAKVKLSDLPIVGSALPADQAIGFESLRIILATADVKQASVASLDELLENTSVKPLSDVSGNGDGKGGLKQGCNITAELLFGKLSHTLSLPIKGGIEKSPQEPTAVEQPGGGQAAAPAKIEGTDSLAKTDDGTKWFEIGKSLGPVSVQRIGLGYAEGRVGIKFDASLQLSALTFTLDGLGMTYPVDKFTEPSQFLKHVQFTLDGMGLALGNGPIEIGGSLVRVPPTSALRQLELEGTLLIRSTAFTFSAFGSYIDENGTISVMAFVVLLAELGDPTATGAFLVTGLAFGFGVNRTLMLPTIEQVQNFPLIKAAMGEDSFAARKQLPGQLREYVSPAPGNFWIAAGIKFNSFGIVDSFLLVSVSWGAEIEIGLLGLSRMSAPTRVTPDKTIACAELALRGVIRIAEGLIQFEARLTENSFIFSNDCRLTGGFAFCVWFKGPHAGDFVISLGGYHPAFQRPGHYPLVPRVGMQLQLGTELSITGEAYFALTPSCMMAGGKLCAVFKSGGIEAWFIAYADFLLNWQPFYYQAEMGITLGIALRLGAIAIRLEASVDLRLQGPPFGGEARVQLWIISFTIPFGEPASRPKPLTPAQFIEKCLPVPKSLPAANAPSQVPPQPDVLSVRITGGLLREQEVDMTTGENVTEHTPQARKRTHRIVNAHQLSLTVQSVIPCTEFEGLGKDLESIEATNPKTGVEEASCGIRPMGERVLHSLLSVELLRTDGAKREKVQVSAIAGNVPDALWGKCVKQGDVPVPKTPENKTIAATIGIRIACVPQGLKDPLLDIPIGELEWQYIDKTVEWASPIAPPRYKLPKPGTTVFNTIWSESVRTKRMDILKCLRDQGSELNEPKLGEFGKLEELSSTTADYFQAEPEMCPLSYS